MLLDPRLYLRPEGCEHYMQACNSHKTALLCAYGSCQHSVQQGGSPAQDGHQRSDM